MLTARIYGWVFFVARAVFLYSKNITHTLYVILFYFFIKLKLSLYLKTCSGAVYYY